MLIHTNKNCWHISWVLQELSKLLDGQSEVYVQPAVQVTSAVAAETIVGETPAAVPNTEASINTTQAPSLNRLFNQIVVSAVEEGSASSSGASRRSLRKPRANVTTIKPAVISTLKRSYNLNNEYEVERLLSKRINEKKNIVEYLVKWKNYGDIWNSWQSVEDLVCDDLLSEFEQKFAANSQSLPTADNYTLKQPVRYLQSRYFVVSYGFGYTNAFCVVGPDKNCTALCCKGVAVTSVPHHTYHVKEVLKLFDPAQPLAETNIMTILPNYGKNINMLASTSTSSTTSTTSTASTEPTETELNDDVDIIVEPKVDQAHSYKSIFLILDENTLNNIGLFNLQQAIKGHHRPAASDIPAQCKCKLPSSYEEADRQSLPYSLLYSEKGVVQVYVYERWCKNSNFTCTIHYDGSSDGIFNYNSKKLFTYSLLFDFLFSLVSGRGTTFGGFVTKINMNYTYLTWKGSKTPQQFVFLKTWICVWIAFQSLLQLKKNFKHCPLCGVYPKTLCFDGVSLAFAKRYVNWEKVDIIPNPKNPHKQSEAIPRASTYILRATSTKNLLNQFVTNELTTAEQWNTLVFEVQTASPALHKLLVGLYNQELAMSGTRHRVFAYSFYGCWNKILQLIAYGESISLIIPPPVVVALHNTIQHDHRYGDEIIELCSNTAPIIADLLHALVDRKIPDYSKDLLQQMLDICIAAYPWLYKQEQDGLLSLEDYQPPEEAVVLPQELPSTESGKWWGHVWPQLRSSHLYPGYDQITSNPDALFADQWANIVEDLDMSKVPLCKKTENLNYKQKPYTAGIFVGCCVHNICYGFHNMYAPEGRKDLFKVLYERMPYEVLKDLNVIFDFACQAAEYASNQEPKLFSRTKFFIDRFHSRGHKRCAAWKLHSYPYFSELCSTASESLNSFLQNFHTQCSFMKQETFMLFIQLVVTVRNWIISNKLEHARDTVHNDL